MDFFEAQDRARRRSGRLILFYALAVASIVGSLYFVALFAGDYAGLNGKRPHQIWDPELFLGVSAATITIILLGSLYRIVQLRSGGSRVAEMMGGRRVNLATSDPDEQRLVNVVEEMAIASGVPVPEIFVMDNEEGINAFAAGYTPSDAAVAVTRGTLQKLNRDELQGVIAHEFSHILNGDMRLNIRLIGILNGILILHLIGLIVLRSVAFTRPRTSRGNGGGGGGAAVLAIAIVGIALIIIGYLGVLCSRMIQAAVSRQREFLADAAAVQFTRNPDGIAGALKKIGGARRGSRIGAAHAMEANHLFFANGIASSLSNIFATHPPLTKRIRAIDPSFDGESWTRPSRAAPKPPPPPKPQQQKSPLGPLTDAVPMEPEVLLATIGTVGSEQVSRAGQILERLPKKVAAAVREPTGAEAAIYCLLLSQNANVRSEQLALIEARGSRGVSQEVSRLHPLIASLPPETRLPLVDLALPALRQISPEQYASFRAAVEALSASDQTISLFEFALEKVMIRHLERHFDPERRRPTVQYYGAAGLATEFSLLLSALAHAGGTDAKQAFAAGKNQVRDLPLQLEAEEDCTLERLNATLDKLGLASYPVKKQLLQAAIAVIVSDQRVAVEEVELLRAIADSLDCPMPPLG